MAGPRHRTRSCPRSRPPAGRGVHRRALRARPHERVRAPDRNDPLGADHRCPGQHGDTGAVRPLSDGARPRRRRPGRGRADRALHRLLRRQDAQHHRDVRRARRAPRRRRARSASTNWSPCPASGARRPTSCASSPSRGPASRSTPTAGAVSRRLGLTVEEEPEAVERDLCALLPKTLWGGFSLRLILHGRRVCTARSPRCDACVVEGFCPSSARPRTRAEQLGLTICRLPE